MGTVTGVQWADHTFSTHYGCTKISAGCEHCYAERESQDRFGLVQWGPRNVRREARSTWGNFAKWNEAAKADGVRRRVFCNSWSDIFEGPETMSNGSYSIVRNARVRLFQEMERATWLDFVLVTKRPQNIMPQIEEVYRDCLVRTSPWPLPNVWLGTTVENQEMADIRIPVLIQLPAAKRVLSVEPLLGPLQLDWVSREPGKPLYSLLEFRDFDPSTPDGRHYRRAIDWVIVGGESGPDARTCDLTWVRSVVRQCNFSRVPCFVKQIGSNPVHTVGGQQSDRGSGRFPIRIHHRKGGDPEEWPEDLRVRQVPATDN